MHHYINFVRKYRVVCVVPLPRHHTPPPSWRRAIGLSPPQNTLLSGNVTCCPDVSFGYGAAHRQTNAAAPHILYNINLYPPATQVTCRGIKRQTVAPSPLILFFICRFVVVTTRRTDAFIILETLVLQRCAAPSPLHPITDFILIISL